MSVTRSAFCGLLTILPRTPSGLMGMMLSPRRSATTGDDRPTRAARPIAATGVLPSRCDIQESTDRRLRMAGENADALARPSTVAARSARARHDRVLGRLGPVGVLGDQCRL